MPLIDPAVYPNLVIYPPVLPREKVASDSVPHIVHKLSLHYPHFDLCEWLQLRISRNRTDFRVPSDPAVYPFNLDAIYPPVGNKPRYDLKAVNCSLEYTYPNIVPCKLCRFYHWTYNSPNMPSPDPAVYPHIEIYPSLTISSDSEPPKSSSGVDVTLKAAYPCFNLCKWLMIELGNNLPTHSIEDPAVYPNFSIYPDVSHKYLEEDLFKGFKVDYPIFDICTWPKVAWLSYFPDFAYDEDPAVYPNFDLYPSIGKLDKANEQQRISTVLPAAYPCINICGALYSDIFASQTDSLYSRSRCLPVFWHIQLRVRLRGRNCIHDCRCRQV